MEEVNHRSDRTEPFWELLIVLAVKPKEKLSCMDILHPCPVWFLPFLELHGQLQPGAEVTRKVSSELSAKPSDKQTNEDQSNTVSVGVKHEENIPEQDNYYMQWSSTSSCSYQFDPRAPQAHISTQSSHITPSSAATCATMQAFDQGAMGDTYHPCSHLLCHIYHFRWLRHFAVAPRCYHCLNPETVIHTRKVKDPYRLHFDIYAPPTDKMRERPSFYVLMLEVVRAWRDVSLTTSTFQTDILSDTADNASLDTTSAQM